MGGYFDLEHGGGRTSKHSMGSYKGMSWWPLVLLVSLIFGSVSANPKNVLDSTEANIVHQLSTLPREKLIRIVLHLFDDEDLVRLGMGAEMLESVSEKRAQKFSSWGGKRNNEEDESETEADIKRAQKFSSWGGKREDKNDHMYRTRRGGGSSFSAWGGKRNDDELADYIKAHLAARSRRDDSPIKVIRPARAAFSAWGGK